MSQQARELMVEICRLGWRRGFLSATDGNLSLRLGEDRLLITPAGRSKALLQAQDMVEVDLEGRPLVGGGRPSAELPMHLAVYQSLPEAKAVVHAHPPLATAFSLANRELDLSGLPEALVHLGQVPTVPYATPGGEDLAEAVRPYLRGHAALLLGHHGSLAHGPDLETAWARTEKIESAAQVILTAKSLGGARPLPLEEQEKLLAMGGHPPATLQGALPPLDRRIEVKHLDLMREFATEKRWRDHRGEAHLIIDNRDLCRVCLLTLNPGAGHRGGHLHRRKHEGFYVVAGRAMVELACAETGERLTLEQEPGDRLWLPPGVAHRITAPGPETLVFVEFTDRPYDPEDDAPFVF